MASAILHFGREIEERFRFLRRRGNFIHCVQNAVDLDQLHQSGIEFDLVSSTDVEKEDCAVAAEEARRHLLVPAILFQVQAVNPLQRAAQKLAKSASPSDYDLVIRANESPEFWIPKLDGLVALGQRLRGASNRLVSNSIQLRQETAAVIEQTEMEIERARSQLEQSDMSSRIPNMLSDRILKCRSCGENFVFPAGEQLLLQLHRFRSVPERCGRCNSGSSAQ